MSQRSSWSVPAVAAALSVAGMALLTVVAAEGATFTVLSLADGGTGSLRQAILDANARPGADRIVFAPQVQGTITLSQGQLEITDSVTIDGPGAEVLAVSGNDASRVFAVTGHRMTSVTITGLTITRGRADKHAPHGSLGGGIYHDGGSLSLGGVVLSGNRAVGDATASVTWGNLPPTAGSGAGGGILNNAGPLTVTDSLFTDNQALGGDHSSGFFAAGLGGGGAIENAATEGVMVIRSRFTSNVARAGSDGSGSFIPCNADGGAIDNGGGGGVLTVIDSTFDDNQVVGGSRCSGDDFVGAAVGGAIVLEGTRGIVRGSAFDRNRAVGGSFNNGGNAGESGGGGIAVTNFGNLTVSGSTFRNNLALGGNANLAAGGAVFPNVFSGTGGGGGILAGSGGGLDVSSSVFDQNVAQGGDDNQASSGVPFVGAGIGGGLVNEFATSAVVSDSTFDHNRAQGGTGGAAVGGGFANVLGGSVTADGVTLVHNQTQGGGDDGTAVGGGFANGFLADDVFPGNAFGPSLATFGDVTITDNLALGGPGGAGLGGGVFVGVSDAFVLAGGRVRQNHANGQPGIGGGVYNLGTLTFDATTDISGNGASTSHDDIFP